MLNITSRHEFRTANRLTHWLNAIAVLVMIMSGLKIYNASPIFNFMIPREITLGGWLGGALLWHFAFMWLLAVNGFVYLVLNLLTGRFWKKFFPLSPKELVQDFLDTLKGKLSHEDLSKYNTIQKLAYLSVIFDLIILVMSGLPTPVGPVINTFWCSAIHFQEGAMATT